MTARIIETVKDAVAQARAKLGSVGAHGKEVIHAGTETLQAARVVLSRGRQDAAEVLTHTRDELKRTLKEGRTQVGERLSRLTTPTHEEEALARKASVRAKKQKKKAEQAEIEEETAA